MGKTLVTGLLLHHLRESGIDALAIKPFCCGGKADVRLLQALQPRELPDKVMNPFYFNEPVAPLIAARNQGKRITLNRAREAIRTAQERCECLIVEGIGGVLVPLGQDYSVADLIGCLKCDTIVVARNKLGTLNHTLLSIEALRKRGVDRIKIVFNEEKAKDDSVKSNAMTIEQIAGNISVLSLPNFGSEAAFPAAVKTIAKKVKKLLHGSRTLILSRLVIRDAAKAAKRSN